MFVNFEKKINRKLNEDGVEIFIPKHKNVKKIEKIKNDQRKA